ncbi:ABC transporter substrate-binding protein [Micromonospora sp. NBC_01796]|uniref:ABC transporter substrate-binding protein n=1 Tax=Micromonospora sp. NBC_01796 TaxID=2975987 RepID=UPI002DDAACAF|nr:ABC transporter substrate-binding protein [Micromonospora sp. NBC_01796]WSA86141.1 ABC transporter substrate-binding protein [Micromonospora sp. NBC_01796]
MSSSPSGGRSPVRHFRRRLGLVTAGAAIGALLLSACSNSSDGPSGSAGGADPDATITIGSLNEPTTLNTVKGGNTGHAQVLLRNVVEGLTVLTDDGKVEPLLAKSWDVSTDGTTYTFHLQSGVTFSDGTPLKAADVVTTLKRVTSDESTSARKKDLSIMKTIEAPDDNTVKIALSQRSQSFLFYLASTGAAVTKPGAGNPETTVVGTGPYTVGTWKQGDSINLVRNDKYWGDKAKNKEVVYRFFKDTTAENNALLAGQLDLVTQVTSPDVLAQFENRPEFTIVEGTSTTKELFNFNDSVAPFNNVDVRKAIRQATDRKALLTAVWAERGQILGSMVPPTDPWYEDLTSIDDHNVEGAKALLAKAGFAGGLSFTVDYVPSDSINIVAQGLKSQLAQAGINITLNPIDDATWTDKVYKNHNFQATIMTHVNQRDLVWYGNPDFYWQYKNPQVQEWVKQSETAATEAEQTELLKKVARQISEDAASDWLYLDPAIKIASSAVSGYQKNLTTDSFYVAPISKQR